MRIKIKTLGAGPDGIWFPGAVVDLSAARARELIERGFADPVDGPSVPEDAVFPGGERAATGERARRARKEPT